MNGRRVKPPSKNETRDPDEPKGWDWGRGGFSSLEEHEVKDGKDEREEWPWGRLVGEEQGVPHSQAHVENCDLRFFDKKP